MDAVVPQDVWRGPRTVKPCGPDPPTLGSSLLTRDFGLTAETQEIGRRWWLKSPDTRESAEQP